MRILSIFLGILLFANFSLADDEKNNFLFSCANAYVNVMHKNPNRKQLESDAKAIVIFPNANKFGLIVGGMYGKGVIIYKDGGSKTLGGIEISDASIGLQAGFESNMLVFYIMNQDLIGSMRKAKVKLGAGAGIVIGTANADVGTFDATNKDLYAYTTKNGFFAGLSLGGVVLNITKTRFSSSDFGYSTLMKVLNE